MPAPAGPPGKAGKAEAAAQPAASFMVATIVSPVIAGLLVLRGTQLAAWISKQSSEVSYLGTSSRRESRWGCSFCACKPASRRAGHSDLRSARFSSWGGICTFGI
jgi:hypothetical protein